MQSSLRSASIQLLGAICHGNGLSLGKGPVDHRTTQEFAEFLQLAGSFLSLLLVPWGVGWLVSLCQPHMQQLKFSLEIPNSVLP